MNGAKTDEKIKEAVETILEKNGIDVDEDSIFDE